MATGFTNNSEAAILDDPTVGLERDLYLALLVNDLGDGTKDGVSWNDDGTEPTNTSEPTGVGNYARILVNGMTATPGDADWDAAVGGAPTSKSTNATLQWTASADYGEVIAFGLWDAASGGNLVFHGPVTLANGTPTHVLVQNSDTFGFDASNPIKAQLGDPTDTFG